MQITSLTYDQEAVQVDVLEQLECVYQELLKNISKKDGMNVVSGVAVIPCIVRQMAQSSWEQQEQRSSLQVVWNFYGVNFAEKGGEDQANCSLGSLDSRFLMQFSWGSSLTCHPRICLSAKENFSQPGQFMLWKNVYDNLTRCAARWVNAFQLGKSSQTQEEIWVELMTKHLVWLTPPEWFLGSYKEVVDFEKFAGSVEKYKNCFHAQGVVSQINEACSQMHKCWLSLKQATAPSQLGEERHGTVTQEKLPWRKPFRQYCHAWREKHQLLLSKDFQTLQKKKKQLQNLLRLMYGATVWQLPSKNYCLLRSGGALFMGSSSFITCIKNAGGAEPFFSITKSHALSKGVLSLKVPSNSDLNKVFSENEIRFFMVFSSRFYSDKALHKIFSCKIHVLLNNKGEMSHSFFAKRLRQLTSAQHLLIDLTHQESSVVKRNFFKKSAEYIILSHILSTLGANYTGYFQETNAEGLTTWMQSCFYIVAEALSKCRTPSLEAQDLGVSSDFSGVRKAALTPFSIYKG